MPIPTVDSRQESPAARSLARLRRSRTSLAQYEAIGVNEIIVTDAVFGDHDEKIATMDLLMREVAGRG